MRHFVCWCFLDLQIKILENDQDTYEVQEQVIRIEATATSTIEGIQGMSKLILSTDRMVKNICG